jgi:hypothetical protein
MATQASLRRIRRDTRMLNVLFACTALSAGLFFMIQRDILPHHAAPPPLAATQAINDNDELYTGAIVVVQRGADQCWRLNFDNRTGAMWAGRYADCNLVTATNENQTRTVPDSVRMQAIAAAFHRQ